MTPAERQAVLAAITGLWDKAKWRGAKSVSAMEDGAIEVRCPASAARHFKWLGERWEGHPVRLVLLPAFLLAGLFGCAPLRPEPYASRHQPRWPAPAADGPLRTEPGEFWRFR